MKKWGKGMSSTNEVDLGTLKGLEEGLVELSPPPSDKDTGMRAIRENVRAITAYIAMGIFGLTVFLSLVVVALDNGAWGQFKELLTLLLPAETALTGSALAFYFGTKDKDQK